MSGNWLIIALVLISILTLYSMINPILVFYSYDLSFTEAEKNWIIFKTSLEEAGYEVKLLKIENLEPKGYIFYYRQKIIFKPKGK